MDANQIQNLFASNVRQLLVDADLDYDKLYEIRLRVGRPLFLTYDGGECFLRQKDTEPYLVTREDLKETLEYVSGYSLYAYEDEIRQGFLSVQGGHRVGVTGKVILDGNRIRGMKYISCINVRLAHEIQGCAEEVLPYIQTREQIMHTLIVSPPRCGKTTLLRDIIRQMSNGWGNISGVTVGVVDERSELAGCYQGIPQNDLGMRTDILDGCPKAEGMQMLIRSMSPVVVAVDELGKEEDFKAVESVIHCGCRLIATAHGASMEETLSQPFFRKLWEARVFQRYIFWESMNVQESWKESMMKMGNAYVPDCRMYSGSGGRSRNGIFRKYETFGADSYTGKTASDGDLPERRDPLRECITAGCFLWSSRKNEWKIQRVSHQCRGQDESGNRRKTFTDMQGMCGKRPEKKLPYPWGKGRFFFFRRISGLYGSGNADATAFPV